MQKAAAGKMIDSAKGWLCLPDSDLPCLSTLLLPVGIRLVNFVGGLRSWQ
jgi:hypothetical protein